jgi:uncharacterized protein related to proFAR isomerase
MLVQIKGIDLIPALSVYNRKPVVLDDAGQYDPLEDEDGKPLTVRDVVEELMNRFPVVFILDINGIENNKPQYDVLQDITDLGRIWVDPGLRTADGLYDLFLTGVDLAVMGTKTLDYREEIEAAIEISDRVSLGIDYDDGIVGKDTTFTGLSPWILAGDMKKLGVTSIFLVSLKRGNPVPHNLVREVVNQGVETYVGGGIGPVEAKKLDELGASGALLDMRTVLEGW